jgi:hypothetical protein
MRELALLGFLREKGGLNGIFTRAALAISKERIPGTRDLNT